MNVTVINHPLVRHKLTLMREAECSTYKFRTLTTELARLMAYEASRDFETEKYIIDGWCGSIEGDRIKGKTLTVVPILRAGLALHQGLMNYFDNADNAFISAYRKHTSETDFDIMVEYLASPSLDGKILFLADPMLATGRSFANVFNALKPLGTPKEIHLFAVIGAQQGIEYLEDKFPETTHLWIATIDPLLNDHGYIVPGLGDAGDLAFGNKME